MIAVVVDKPRETPPLVAPHPANPGSVPYHVTSSNIHGAFKSIAEYNFKKKNFIKKKPTKHIFSPYSLIPKNKFLLPSIQLEFSVSRKNSQTTFCHFLNLVEFMVWNKKTWIWFFRLYRNFFNFWRRWLVPQRSFKCTFHFISISPVLNICLFEFWYSDI